MGEAGITLLPAVFGPVLYSVNASQQPQTSFEVGVGDCAKDLGGREEICIHHTHDEFRTARILTWKESDGFVAS